MKIRAAVLRTMSSPTPYANSTPLTIETIDLDPPGPGEVLVRIAAAGLCHSDLSVMNGDRPRPLPMVLGHEAAGVVAETGAQVDDLRPGDHVVLVFIPSCGHCVPCAEGRPALCEPAAVVNSKGELLSGARRLRSGAVFVNHHVGCSAFADHAVVSRRSLVKIDQELPLTQAALFGCAVLTGVGAVVNTAKVKAGQSVAVVGLGGVGLACLLGAIAAGAAQVIAVDLADQKLTLAKSRICHGQRSGGHGSCTGVRHHKRRRGLCLRNGGIRERACECLQDDSTRRHDGDGRSSRTRCRAAGAGSQSRRGRAGIEGQLQRELCSGARHSALHRAVPGWAACR